jgi:hypothetical protein
MSFVLDCFTDSTGCRAVSYENLLFDVDVSMICSNDNDYELISGEMLRRRSGIYYLDGIEREDFRAIIEAVSVMFTNTEQLKKRHVFVDGKCDCARVNDCIERLKRHENSIAIVFTKHEYKIMHESNYRSDGYMIFKRDQPISDVMIAKPVSVWKSCAWGKIECKDDLWYDPDGNVLSSEIIRKALYVVSQLSEEILTRTNFSVFIQNEVAVDGVIVDIKTRMTKRKSAHSA